MQKFLITYSYRSSEGTSLQPVSSYVETASLAQAIRVAADSLEAEQIVPVNRNGTTATPIISANVQAVKVSPLTQRNIAGEVAAIHKAIGRHDAPRTPRRSSF